MAKKSSTDFAKQKSAIVGRFAKEDALTLEWMPEYIKEFPKVIKNVPLPLKWEKCKFVRAAENLIPQKFGVYCFSIILGDPFPKEFHLPLYIGKASDQYLSERFIDYFGERGRIKGREKVVVMLNQYRGQLFFWWAEVQGAYVSVVENHLLMCCNPPCNDKRPNREKLWGKAFD